MDLSITECRQYQQQHLTTEGGAVALLLCVRVEFVVCRLDIQMGVSCQQRVEYYSCILYAHESMQGVPLRDVCVKVRLRGVCVSVKGNVV